MKTLVNGSEQETVPLADRGLQYGDGLFETIAVCAGKPLLWDPHMQRLSDACRRLFIPMPDRDLLRSEVAQLTHNEQRAVAKIIVTRGVSRHGYRPDSSEPPTRVVLCRPWPNHPAGARTLGVSVRWCRMRVSRQPRLAGMKHLNRLEQVLARSEWQDEYAEGLMCDDQGRIIEGTATNLFLVHEGTLITPDLSESGVAGVMRAQILRHAQAMGMNWAVQPVTRPQVEAAEELFLTNSLIGIWPVTQLETRRYVVGKTTQTLQAALQAANCLAPE